jgi:hypothetical protein
MIPSACDADANLIDAKRSTRDVAAFPRPLAPRKAPEEARLMALNIVKSRPLVDLYVRRDYTGEFRVRVQVESGQRYVITIKEEYLR